MSKTYIKIIAGVYGLVEGKRVVRKTSQDDPFLVPVDEAKRLVSMKVAEYAEVVEGDSSSEEAEYSTNMKFEALKEIALKYGVDPEKVEAAKSKVEVVNLIDEFKAADETLDGEDKPPAFNPEGIQ